MRKKNYTSWKSSPHPHPRFTYHSFNGPSLTARLLPIVLALFLALIGFASIFFYILSQKALLALFWIFDWLFV